MHVVFYGSKGNILMESKVQCCGGVCSLSCAHGLCWFFDSTQTQQAEEPSCGRGYQHYKIPQSHFRLGLIDPGTKGVWWVDPGWMLGSHPSYSGPPLLSWTGERKCNKRLVVQGKENEKSLTSFCLRKNGLSLGKCI